MSAGCRRFTLRDAAVLLAAAWIACVTALRRWHEQVNVEEAAALGDEVIRTTSPAFALFLFAEPLLIFGSCAWLMIRLRAPRPSSRRLFREPGMVAVATAMGFLALDRLECLAVVAIATLADASGGKPSPPPPVPFDPWSLFAVQRSFGYWGYWTEQGVGYAVVAAWALLIAGRRLRAGRDWIDLVGIALGVGWISYTLHFIIAPPR